MGTDDSDRSSLSAPPPRPRSLDPSDLGFEPQPAVRWYNPGVFTGSGLRVGMTSVFGSFLDKRELQAHKPATVDRSYATRDELWIDFAADTGDGFAATMTVASHLGRRSLTVDVDGTERVLPRGDVLVLGGDEVYPGATAEDYENRFAGPLRAALPWTVGEHPALYAIPGDHDWHDGLTEFLRLFTQQRWLGGWRTRQGRSYFALELPHGWWLWGIDAQPDTYIDEPQLEFFREVAAEASPGDKLILATPTPTWTYLERDPRAFRNLAFVERTLVRPRGIDLRLTLAGNSHHYTRYSERGRGGAPDTRASHKITSGGGGAFLHPTHDRCSEVQIVVDPEDPDDRATYRMQAAYPDRATSRRQALGALALPWRNLGFMLVPAVLTVALLWTNQFGLRTLGDAEESFAAAGERWGWADLFIGLFRNPLSAVTVVALLGGLWALAKPPPWASRGWPGAVARTVMAAVHTLAQVATIVAVSLLALTVASWLVDGGAWFTVAASLVAFAGGGVACSLAFGAYLAAANALPGMRTHGNETFAAARITSHKNFLRLHLDGDGRLTVYVLGIERAVRRRDWRPDPDNGDPEAPLLVPVRGDSPPRLIDRIVVE